MGVNLKKDNTTTKAAAKTATTTKTSTTAEKSTAPTPVVDDAVSADSTSKVITLDIDKTAKQPLVDFIQWFQGNYYVGVPIIEGKEHRELMVGGSSPEEVQNGLNMVKEAYERSNGNLNVGMIMAHLAMNCAADKVAPTKELTYNGRTYLIDTDKQALYYVSGGAITKILTLEDLPEEVRNAMTPEVVETILIDRLKNRV